MKAPLCQAEHYGHPVIRREVAGFRLSERIYSPHFRTPKHTHGQAYFCFVMEGASSQTCGIRTYRHKPLTTIFCPPGIVQSESFDTMGGRNFVIEIDSVWLHRFRDYSLLKDYPVQFQGGPLVSIAMKLYCEFGQVDEFSPLVVERLSLEMIGE